VFDYHVSIVTLSARAAAGDFPPTGAAAGRRQLASSAVVLPPTDHNSLPDARAIGALLRQWYYEGAALGPPAHQACRIGCSKKCDNMSAQHFPIFLGPLSKNMLKKTFSVDDFSKM
jgi:hypothetical protein